MREYSALDRMNIRRAVIHTRDTIKNIIQDCIGDGELEGVVEDIEEYLQCSGHYLSYWSDYIMDYNPDGYLTIKLFWKGDHCATITFRSVTGTYVEDVDWVKEGF